LTEVYQVSTPDFAGPMDLLVFMVRRRELDVAYISVGAIAADYLTWIERMQPLDLNNAGDFILLAVILLQLKAAELLPSPAPEPMELELLPSEHQRSYDELIALKASIARLAELEELQINLFDRGGIHISGLDRELAGEMLSDVSIYDVAVAFHGLIQKLPTEPTHIIEDIPYSLEGQTAFILSFFEKRKRIAFRNLANALESRLAVIMTFLAMLELMRIGRVVVKQQRPFGEFELILFDSGKDE